MENMTSNPPSVIDERELSVRRTIRIAAGIEKVWSAIVEPEHISRWFGQTVLDGAGVGASGSIGWPDREPVPLRVEAVDPPHMISYRWCEHGNAALTEIDEEHSTVFTFTLEPLPDGTQLTVVETGFENTPDPAATLASHSEGWTKELDKLVALLEGGS